MPRIYSRDAFLTAIGTSAVHAVRDLPVGFFDGMAASEQEAASMAFRVNVERRRQRNMARARKGLAGVLGG